MSDPQPGKVVFVQFGDFRDAARRIAATGQETFHAQRYSVEFVERLARSATVTVIALDATAAYEERLENGILTLGVAGPWGSAPARQRVLALLRRLAPDALILRTASRVVLKLCLAERIRVLPCLADSFGPRPGVRGLVDRVGALALGRLLADPRIPWVSNHNVPASRALVALGVPPAKIVPWDWPRPCRPADSAARTRSPGQPVRLLCLGTVSEQKGVGDAIRALAASPDLRRHCRLTVIGPGSTATMAALADRLGIGDRVDVLGPIPFAEVMPTMHAHDVLIVYSRPDYSEGMPGVIYQGLAARVPIVMSRHPMFLSAFADGADCVMAEPADPQALAKAILRLIDSPALYGVLSAGADAAFAKIEYPVLWGDVLTNWLRNDAEGDSWLAARTLAQMAPGRGG